VGGNGTEQGVATLTGVRIRHSFLPRPHLFSVRPGGIRTSNLKFGTSVPVRFQQESSPSASCIVSQYTAVVVISAGHKCLSALYERDSIKGAQAAHAPPDPVRSGYR